MTPPPIDTENVEEPSSPQANDTDDPNDSVDESTGSPSFDALTRKQVMLLNGQIHGQLTIHFAERDVVYEIDGATAMSAIGVYCGDLDDTFTHTADPTSSLAVVDMVCVDMKQVLGMRWVPSDKITAPKG